MHVIQDASVRSQGPNASRRPLEKVQSRTVFKFFFGKQRQARVRMAIIGTIIDSPFVRPQQRYVVNRQNATAVVAAQERATGVREGNDSEYSADQGR